MKKKYWGILALAALPPTLATASSFHHVAGSGCGTSFSNNLIQRGPGVTNYGTQPATVDCAIDISNSTSVSPITVNPSTVRVDFTDGNDDPSFGDVECRLMVETSTATIVTTPWQYSCAASGGCTMGGTSYTGVGFLTIPDTILSTANVVAMDVQCIIPYLQSGGATTTVYGIGAATTTP